MYRPTLFEHVELAARVLRDCDDARVRGRLPDLVADGRESAPAIAEHARTMLTSTHPALEGFSFNGRPPRPVVADANALTAGVAALINELMWTAGDQEDGGGPAEILRELTHERRHLFQSAGLFDRMSWKLS